MDMEMDSAIHTSVDWAHNRLYAVHFYFMDCAQFTLCAKLNERERMKGDDEE